MEDLSNISTEELREELNRRPGALGYCPTCNEKWPLYMGCSDSWQEKPHCYGCGRTVVNCSCG